MKDIKVGSHSTYEFKDNEVDHAIMLAAQYKADINYRPSCNIEFTAQISNKNKTLEYDTILIVESV